jgi:hypothetical protein
MKMDSASQRSLRWVGRTSVTVTRSTIDGYALPPETIDDLARALTSVLGAVYCMLGSPSADA